MSESDPSTFVPIFRPVKTFSRPSAADASENRKSRLAILRARKYQNVGGGGSRRSDPDLGGGGSGQTANVDRKRKSRPPLVMRNQRVAEPASYDDPSFLKTLDGKILTDSDLIKIMLPQGTPVADIEKHAIPSSSEFFSEQANCMIKQQESSRPVQTKKSYYTRVRHFVEWCEAHKCRPVPHVNRILSFLFWRQHNEIGLANPLTQSTLSSNIFALQDAQSKVKHLTGMDLGVEVSSHPSVRMMGRVMKLESADKREMDHVDPQRNTIADTLTPEDFARMLHHAANVNKSTNYKYGSMMACAKAMIFRGDDQRSVRLCDMFLQHMPKKAIGPSPCTALCIVSYRGKKNQGGVIQYGFGFRHADPMLCCHGWLARHLFHRFMCEGEPVPDLSENKTWFPTLLWPSRVGLRTKLSVEAHRKFVKAIITFLQIPVSKCLHLFRPAGAYEAALNDCQFDEIMRSGRWRSGSSNASLAMHYLGSIAGQVGVVLAGCSPDTKQYFIERDSKDPEKELLVSVFPFLTALEATVVERNANLPFSKKQVAAHHFVATMWYFAKILLQDAAYLPNLPMFSPGTGHAVFQSEKFLKYAQEVRSEGETRRLQYAEQIRGSHGNFEELKDYLAKEMEKLHVLLNKNNLKTKVEEHHASSPIPSSTSAAPIPSSTPFAAPVEIHDEVQMPRNNPNIPSTTPFSTSPNLNTHPVPSTNLSSSLTSLNPLPTPISDPPIKNATPLPSTSQTHSSVVENDKYLIGTHHTVTSLWREFWVKGPHGRLPIIQLMAKYGITGWYSPGPDGTNNRINRWGNVSRPVVLEILWKVMKDKKDVSVAVAEVESMLEALVPPTVDNLARRLLGRIKPALGVAVNNKSEAREILEEAVLRRREMCEYNTPEKQKRIPKGR